MYRCYERLKPKTGGSKSIVYTRWSGGRGDLRRGKWIGFERFVSGRGEFVCVKPEDVISMSKTDKSRGKGRRK